MKVNVGCVYVCVLCVFQLCLYSLSLSLSLSQVPPSLFPTVQGEVFHTCPGHPRVPAQGTSWLY